MIVIISIITFFIGLGIGILSNFIRSKINLNKFRMRKYKNKLYSTILEVIQEMPSAYMTIEDFRDNIYQNTVYKLIIKNNINNIESMDIYEYIFRYCETHKNLNIDETIIVKYQKLQEQFEKDTYSNMDVENGVEMPDKFTIPDEIYNNDRKLTDPFRMS